VERGRAPTPVLRDLPLQHARNGGIIVGRDFAVPDRPGVWALAMRVDSMKTPGEWYPMTAQHAIREGPALARNIAACCTARRRSRSFTALGTMASLGARSGVASLANGLVISGFPAWFLWRTYYLSRLPGFDRKVRVALDWLLGLIFRRDIAELRVYTQRSSDRGRDAGWIRPAICRGRRSIDKHRTAW